MSTSISLVMTWRCITVTWQVCGQGAAHGLAHELQLLFLHRRWNSPPPPHEEVAHGATVWVTTVGTHTVSQTMRFALPGVATVFQTSTSTSFVTATHSRTLTISLKD